MVEQILAAVLVLALLMATLWLLRRKGMASVNLTLPKRFGGARQIQILERVSLTAHHSLHLIRVHDRTLLIGVSPSGCTRVASLRSSSTTARQEANDELS